MGTWLPEYCHSARRPRNAGTFQSYPIMVVPPVGNPVSRIKLKQFRKWEMHMLELRNILIVIMSYLLFLLLLCLKEHNNAGFITRNH